VNPNDFSAQMLGTLKMSINKGGSPANAVLTTTDPISALTYAGNLVVTNVGGALALNDSFQLFNSTPGYFSGSFDNVTLPALTAGLAWQDNLLIDGTITVVAGSVPPSIVTDLVSDEYSYVGGDDRFMVEVNGDPVLVYQWKKNGTTPVGPDSPTLALTSVSLADDADYSVTVTNGYGTTSSSSSHLFVASPDLVGTEVMQDTPLALWPLGESAASTAYDYASWRNGAQSGSLVLGVDGPRPPDYAGFSASKTAYQFDGATTGITLGTNASLSGATDFTVEAWIKAAGGGRIIQQRDSTPSGWQGQYAFSVTSGGAVSFYIYNSGYQWQLTSTRTVTDGKWHHVAGVRDGTEGYIYIDGTLAATGSGDIKDVNGALNAFIGYDGRDSNNYFNGLMCDVALYDYAVSAARIADHAYTGILATGDLVLDTAPGGFIEDSKPLGTLHHGYNYGITWVTNVADLNGTNRAGVAQFNASQVVIPPDADFDSTNGTICFWMKAAAPLPGPGNEAAMLFDRRTGSGTVIVLTDAGGIKVQCAGGANTYEAGPYMPDELWHHVAVTYNQSAGGSVEIFVDGVSYGSQANSSAWSWPTSQQLELGKSHDTYWKRFNGDMDDFRIYNRVLTQPELASIVSSDALVDTSALKVRYNFGTAAGVGTSLTWPLGTLESTPTLNPPAWTPVSGAVSPYPWLLPAPSQPTNPAAYYRLTL
jgi:hypothetical protein